MKTRARIAATLLLGMNMGFAQGKPQGPEAPVGRLHPLKVTTDTSRFGGPWAEVAAKPFLGLNPLGGTEPMSGQVSAIAVDLVHDPTGNLVYVGSSSGGVWKSTNGLSAHPKFVPISDQSQSLSVGALALDTRTNPPTIYVGTGAPDNSSNISGYTGVGILSTHDNGATWSKVDSADKGAHTFVGLGFSSIIVDPVNPDTLLAATGMANDPNHPHASIPQGDPGFNSLGIYRSTDAGKTWTQVMPANYSTQPSTFTCWGVPDVLNPIGFFHIDLLYEPTQAIYYAGITGVGLLASSDHGATWKSFADLGLGAGLPAGNQIFKVSLSSRKGELWALLLMNPCSTSGTFSLHQSVNNGKTWRQLILPAGGLFKGALMYVAAPPGSRLLLMATQSLFSMDTLARPSWTNIEHNIHGDQHAIAFAGPTSWYTGDDGGAWATTDSGNTWTSLNADLHTLEFFSADEDSSGSGLFAGGLQDNGPVLASGGGGWRQSLFADGMYVAADPQDPSAFFMSVQFGNIFYVSTASPSNIRPLVNFNGAGMPTDFLTPFEVLAADSRVRGGTTDLGWTIAQSGRILLTAGTNPWLVAFDPAAPSNACQLQPTFICNRIMPPNPMVVQLTNGINQVINYIAPVAGDPTTAYLVAGTSLFRLSNISFAGNATVTPITGGPVNGDVLGHLAVGPGETLYLIKAGFLKDNKVFKTSDAGKTWTNISGNLPNVPLNWITLDPANPGTIYLASNTGVFTATDGGVVNEQWQVLGTGLPNVPVTQLKIVPGRRLLAATYGRNVWALSDPCQPLRTQLQNFTCDARLQNCAAMLRDLQGKVISCAKKYGEVFAP